jgi:hypothetical protein
VLYCVGTDLYDELISRPKESHPFSNRIQKPKKGHWKTSTEFLIRKNCDLKETDYIWNVETLRDIKEKRHKMRLVLFFFCWVNKTALGEV